MDLFKILWLCCQLQWAYCFFPTQLRSWVWSKFGFSVTTLAPLVATWPELSSFQTMAAAFDLQRKLSTKCLWNLELFIALSFPQVSTGCWRLNANLTIEELHIRFYTAGVKENIFTVFGNSLVDWIDKTVCHQQLKCLKPSEAECKHRRPWWLFGLFSQSIPLDCSLSKWVYNS